MKLRRSPALLAGCVLFAVACASGDSEESTPAPPSTSKSTNSPDSNVVPPDTPPDTPPLTATPSSTPVAGDDRVEAARADLAAQFGYPVEQIDVVLVEPVTWPSTALGCPTYGESYDQRPVDGYRIVLLVGDLDFHYHGADQGSPPRLCQFLD